MPVEEMSLLSPGKMGEGTPPHPLDPPKATAYDLFLKYGDKKANKSIVKMLIQSLTAGYYVALGTHFSTIAGGVFFDDSKGAAKLLYSLLFPTGLILIYVTESELFTGNISAMALRTLHHKGSPPAIAAAIRVLLLSLIGNFLGGIFGAYTISYLGQSFAEGGPHRFLTSIALHKVGLNFVSALCLGIGCNVMVCAAVFSLVVLKEESAKLIAMYAIIASFAMGGLEHIIANFCSLFLASISCTAPGLSLQNVAIRNWIPVLVGNFIGGSVLTGGVWWYTLRRPTQDRRIVDTASERLALLA